MTPSENRRWALFGPLAVVLWVVGIILITRNGPAEHATGGQILAWYKSDSDTITLGAWLFMLGCLGFVTFVAGLRVRLSDAAARGSQLPMLALVGAAMAGLSGILTAGADLAGESTRTTSTPQPPQPSIIWSTSSSSGRRDRRDPPARSGGDPRLADTRPAALVGCFRRPRRGRAHRRPDRVARPDLRRADLDSRHEPVRALALIGAHAGGRCDRLNRRRGGAPRGRRASLS
jgi:hypothetical protein